MPLTAATYTPPDDSRPNTRRQTWNSSSSSPSSPLSDVNQNTRSHRYPTAGPSDSSQSPNSLAQGNVSSTRQTQPPNDSRTVHHVRQKSSTDGLPSGNILQSSLIRVIYAGGQTKTLNIKNCTTAENIVLTVLKKLLLPENHFKNYCFYVLDGLEPNPANCRRISDSELLSIVEDTSRSERGRLILRKIHAGEPDMEEVDRAAQIASNDQSSANLNALGGLNIQNQAKLQKLTNDTWHQRVQPLSRRGEAPTSAIHARSNTHQARLRSFFGARPPSEMIIHELTSYFPSHQKEDIEKTVRMSVHRSKRLSRAASRLSVVSNVSYASSLKDAPPIPSIADTWLAFGGEKPTARTPRPLSVSRFNAPQLQLHGLPGPSFRDSTLSALKPLAEESVLDDEPDRKSFVAFENGTYPNSGDQEFEGGSLPATEGTNLLNQRLSVLMAEDGDEQDDGLNAFLAGDNFTEKSWMKGSLIGEGSFGSVFLALHAITGELMAVKQVEVPSVTKGTELDTKKTAMINALKHEIDLLQGMSHPNIVQYLGTSTDDEHLNIFLEYVPGGSIAMMLNQYNTFQEPLIKNFVRQILQGLSYLHSKDIIHRDIKGANILVDNKGGVKISDFGLSKRVEASTVLGTAAASHRPSLQGSVFWMAPEVVRQTAHTKKADIWSLGCLVVEMFIGAHPFPDCSQLQAIFAIGSTQARPPAPATASSEAKSFLNMTFEIDHEKRPNADELMGHPFLKPPAIP